MKKSTEAYKKAQKVSERIKKLQQESFLILEQTLKYVK